MRAEIIYDYAREIPTQKQVIIERLFGAFPNEYRVLTAERFTNLEDAKAAFLGAVPSNKYKYYEQIVDFNAAKLQRPPAKKNGDKNAKNQRDRA